AGLQAAPSRMRATKDRAVAAAVRGSRSMSRDAASSVRSAGACSSAVTASSPPGRGGRLAGATPRARVSVHDLFLPYGCDRKLSPGLGDVGSGIICREGRQRGEPMARLATTEGLTDVQEEILKAVRDFVDG